MSEVSVNEIQLLPLLAVTVGDQPPIFLDEDTAAELYMQLTAVLDGPDAVEAGFPEAEEAFDAGRAAATYQRPTVWFDYGNPPTCRNVIPVTIRTGVDDVLLVGIELAKDGTPHPEPLLKSYRTGTLDDVIEGHAVTWAVGA